MSKDLSGPPRRVGKTVTELLDQINPGGRDLTISELAEVLKKPGPEGMIARTDLRHLRVSTGVLLKDLASALGVSKRAVAHWEDGDYCPTLRRVCEISLVLGVSLEMVVISTLETMKKGEGEEG